ncbi:MAG: fluoride efflux transporter CrcB [Desulfurococcales archaeon]|nr:fluoride efflux transporter CrcB [Desulfurococcales archaeon]
MRLNLGGVILVFTGGGLGALTRWLLSEYVQEKIHGEYPWGTITVNLVGSFLLGFIMGAALNYGAFTREERLFLATGFAGSFTTFSTFEYETLRLTIYSPRISIINAVMQVIIGLVLVYLGYVVAGVVYR